MQAPPAAVAATGGGHATSLMTALAGVEEVVAMVTGVATGLGGEGHRTTSPQGHVSSGTLPPPPGGTGQRTTVCRSGKWGALGCSRLFSDSPKLFFKTCLTKKQLKVLPMVVCLA